MVTHSALPQGFRRTRCMERLHLFAGSKVNAKLLLNVSNQLEQPQCRPVPLQDMSEEFKQQFPDIVRFAPNHDVYADGKDLNMQIKPKRKLQ